MRIFNFFRPGRDQSFVQNWELTQNIYDSKKRAPVSNRRRGLFLGLSALLFVFVAAGSVFLVSRHGKTERALDVPGFDQEQLSPTPSDSPADSLLEVKNKFLEEKAQVKKLKLKENVFKFPEVDWQIKVGGV